ncbi:MAG: MurR/RpiR family transcriptional regulator [Candidatus Fimivivens sp.]
MGTLDNDLVVSLNPIERINAQLPDLSKTHRKIAEYMLKSYDKAIFLTSLKVAQKSGVSESSVIRFATTLGYSGYAQLQHELQEMLKQQLSLTQRLTDIVEVAETEHDILDTVVNKNIEGIKKLRHTIDPTAFRDATELLAKSDRVFLIGSRSSYGMIHFLGLNLGWIRDGVHIINGESHEFDQLSSLTPHDVVLAISLPHYLKSTIQALRYAHNRKACTICITDTATSPIVKYAAVPLLTNTQILSYSDNIVPEACLITALLNAVGLMNRMDAQKILQNRENFWRECNIYGGL